MPRIKALLEVHGMNVSEGESWRKNLTYLKIENTAAMKPRSLINLVLGQVSPGLMARVEVPRAGEWVACEILNRLRFHATAFRLMDLRPELLDRIYALHFRMHLTEYAIDLDDDKSSASPGPALRYVSRQVSRESMYQAVLKIPIRLRCSVSREAADRDKKIADMVRKWDLSVSSSETIAQACHT